MRLCLFSDKEIAVREGEQPCNSPALRDSSLCLVHASKVFAMKYEISEDYPLWVHIKDDASSGNETEGLDPYEYA